VPLRNLVAILVAGPAFAPLLFVVSVVLQCGLFAREVGHLQPGQRAGVIHAGFRLSFATTAASSASLTTKAFPEVVRRHLPSTAEGKWHCCRGSHLSSSRRPWPAILPPSHPAP